MTRDHATRPRHTLGSIPAAAALALALALGACDDPTDVGGHAAADGVAIVSGDAEIYRWMLDDGGPPPLSLAIGVHEVAFLLLDEDGDPLAHEEHEQGEEEEELQVTIGDASILTWTPEDHGAEGHEHLEFHGELHAVAAGATSLALCLTHGEHCDFETPETAPISVTVQQ